MYVYRVNYIIKYETFFFCNGLLYPLISISALKNTFNLQILESDIEIRRTMYRNLNIDAPCHYEIAICLITFSKTDFNIPLIKNAKIGFQSNQSPYHIAITYDGDLPSV